MLRRAKKRSNDDLSKKSVQIKSNRKSKNARVKTLGLTENEIEDAEEARLAMAVLGHVGSDSIITRENVQSDSASEDDLDNEDFDDSPSAEVVGVLDKEKAKPAWVDDDDEQISVSKESKGHHGSIWQGNDNDLDGKELKKRLQSQFEKTVGSAPSWAKLKSERKKKKKAAKSDGDLESESESDDDNDEDDEDVAFLRQAADYMTSSQQLPKTSLTYQKLKNANKERPCESRVTSVQFHTTSQVLLTASQDTNLILFQVDGKLNPMIQTVHLDYFPITRARFSADGQEVIMASKHKHFFVYDMIAGNIIKIPNIKGTKEKTMMKFEVSPDGKFLAFVGSYGYIYLLSARNKELRDILKMNGDCIAVSFTPDGSKLLSIGGDGDVYVWDMSTRDCVHKFVDAGCIKGTSLAVSRNNQYMAVGCESGVVNIYDQSCLSQTRPKPIKSVMNLVTPATSLVFNHTSEILAASSLYTQNACKLIHLPSCQVFPNFPAFREKMGCADCLDISPHSGYLTIGNSRGEALLYRLKHYTDY